MASAVSSIGHQRIGPVDLIDVDVICAQAAQRIIDFLHDPLAGRIAVNLTVTPFHSRLGGYDRLRAHLRSAAPTISSATAEAVNRRSIDQIDALIEGGRMVAIDSRSSVPPHIQPPIAQVPSPTRETFSDVSGICTTSAWRAGIRGFGCEDMRISSPVLTART